MGESRGLALELTLSFESESVRGELRPAEGSPRAFAGYSGLIAALESIRAGDPAEHATTTTEEGK